MEKRNTLILTIIGVATLLISVVGATFAYFASNINTNSNVGVNVHTSPNKAVFTAAASGSINVTVDAVEMQEGDATDDGTQSSNTSLIDGLTGKANLNVTLKASDNGQLTTCTYDIVYTWTGGESNFTGSGYESLTEAGTSYKYYPSKYYVRTGYKDESGNVQDGTEGFKEFTIEGTLTTGTVGTEGTTSDDVFKDGNHGEKNIDTFGIPNDKNQITLVSKEQITSTSTANETYANYEFTIRFYNINKDQSALMGKTFAGNISVANVVC